MDVAEDQYVAQNGEDRWLDENWNSLGLPDKGVFCEVGAGNGKWLSNTYWLEKERGWNGLLIEPDSRHHPSILSDRSARLIDCAVGKSEGMTLFVKTDDPILSGVLRIEGERITIPVRPLTAVLADAGISHLDVLSIDTEGTELDVWAGLDLSKFRPKVVFIEWETLGMPTQMQEIVSRLNEDGYWLATTLGCNLVFISEH